MATTLAQHQADLHTQGPKKGVGKRGQLEFSTPGDEWKRTKTWEFTQIQGLVNLLTTSYEVVPLEIPSAKIRDERAIACAVTCGFFEPSDCKGKSDINAHLKVWLGDIYSGSFVPYMATMQSILGRSTHPHKDTKKLRVFYKRAKSAIQNGRFSATASTSLNRIIQALVKQGQN